MRMGTGAAAMTLSIAVNACLRAVILLMQWSGLAIKDSRRRTQSCSKYLQNAANQRLWIL
jgi:hypothetical protein